MHPLLKNLDLLLAKKKLTLIEQKRLKEDLDRVHDWIKKEEYNKGGFATNKFDVPDRTKEFYVYLNFYTMLGKTWAAVLKQIGVNKYKEVVDLCPGYTPKIELALFYLNYKGTLTVLDKSASSMRELVKFMDLFNPKFKFNLKKTDLFKPGSKPRKKYKLVVANHMVDDLVIDHFCAELGFTLNDVYQKEGAMIKVWNHVLANENKNIQTLTKKISGMINSLTAVNGLFLMSQYESYMERLLDLDRVTKFNKKLLHSIAKDLCQNNFTNLQKPVKEAFKNHKGHFGVSDCFVLKKIR